MSFSLRFRPPVHLLVDVLLLGLLLVLVENFARFWGPPTKRGFFCDDQSLMYPYHENYRQPHAAPLAGTLPAADPAVRPGEPLLLPGGRGPVGEALAVAEHRCAGSSTAMCSTTCSKALPSTQSDACGPTSSQCADPTSRTGPTAPMWPIAGNW
ncbi:hypothetical protein M5D96_009241 [Drosophila gunungcola]|uniref:Uncharacterized protein n=1 Tax=Drosophila gunungcola TaxID=103775 RepID=A0A9P9YJ37_9MUSC|nr:hypothetical protein M5D96_009241 [Drosophila gunungcola]